MTLTRQQSHTDGGATHLRFEYSSLKKKNEKQTTTTKKKKSTTKGQRQYEMLTVVCFIALDSRESAPKRVVLMKNMSDAFLLDCVYTEGTKFIQRGRGAFRPDSHLVKQCHSSYTEWTEWNDVKRDQWFLPLWNTFAQRSFLPLLLGETPSKTLKFILTFHRFSDSCST